MTEPETDPSSQDPVEEVQKLIHALPDAKGITEENLEEVMAQLDAIDEAKAMFTEEQTARLDFNRYDEAAAAVMALMGMEGANEPLTISDIYETKTVSYMDENGKQTSHLAEIVTNQSYQNDTVIWGENSSSDRYYVIEGNVNIDGLIEVIGTAHLILADGATLNAKRGILSRQLLLDWLSQAKMILHSMQQFLFPTFVQTKMIIQSVPTAIP